MRPSLLFIVGSFFLAHSAFAAELVNVDDGPRIISRHAVQENSYGAQSLVSFAAAPEDFTGVYGGTMSLRRIKPLVKKEKLDPRVQITLHCSAPDSFQAQYLIQQSGIHVSVLLPARGVLNGKAKGSSFIANRKLGKMREVLKGKTVSSSERVFSLEIKHTLIPGVSCTYSYQGHFYSY